MISAKLNQGKNILWVLRRTKICPLSYKIPLLLLSLVADELEIYRNCYKTAVYKPYAHLISIHFLFFFLSNQNKKIIGVTCSTDDARQYLLSRDTKSSTPTYTCTCRGSVSHNSSGLMKCYIHFWECPLET